MATPLTQAGALPNSQPPTPRRGPLSVMTVHRTDEDSLRGQVLDKRLGRRTIVMREESEQ